MAQQILVTAHVPSKDSSLDGFTNAFAFETTGTVVPGNLLPIMNNVAAFYNNAGTGGTNAVGKYLGPSLDTTSGHLLCQVYNITGHLDGTPHGSPIASSGYTLTSPTGSNALPEGVACCLNFQSDYGIDVEFGPSGSIPTPADIIADYGAASTHTGKTRPRARDRNRIYIGPLNASATQNASTGRCQFTSQFITDVLAALFSLSGTISDGSGNSYNLRQWSRRNASCKIPTEAWCDDRPDYQRRRADTNPGTRTYRALAAT